MEKKQKVLLIVGTIIVVGLIAYFGYQKYVEEFVNVKIEEHVQPLYQLDDIVRVEYKANELMTLEKQGEVWVNSDQPDLKYNQDMVNQWLTSLTHLETKEVVKNIQDEQAYGISDGSVMITLYDAMNHHQTIQLGNIVKAEDRVYIKCNDEDKLYVLSYEAAKPTFVHPNEFVDCSHVLKIGTLESIKIENQNDKAITLVKNNQWQLKDYYAIPGVVDEKVIEPLTNAILEMQISGYVGTYEDLASYGLDQPNLVLTLNGKTKIAFGNQRGNKVYVTVNDGQDVYTMEKAFYNQLMTFRPFNAIDKQVVHINSASLIQVTLVNPQGIYELKFNEVEPEAMSSQENVTELVEDQTTLKEDELGEAITKEVEAQETTAQGTVTKETKEIINVTLNEKALTEDEAQEWLDQIESSIYIEAPLQNPSIEQKEERKAEATIQFVLKDQYTIDIELIPYDINYYILRYNGITEFAVNKDKVTKLFNDLTEFVKK